jgi:hypothetical protein
MTKSNEATWISRDEVAGYHLSFRDDERSRGTERNGDGRIA